MPLDEALATYRYFLEQADRLGLAYFSFIRYSEELDMVYDGEFHLSCLNNAPMFVP